MAATPIATSGDVWTVVGGSSKGGLIVREGKGTKSRDLDQRLATGAVVKALEIEGSRMHYELVTGTGPRSGWVSTVVQGKDMLALNRGAEEEAEVHSSDEPSTEDPSTECDELTAVAESEQPDEVDDVLEVMLTYGNRFGAEPEEADGCSALHADSDVFTWQAGGGASEGKESAPGSAAELESALGAEKSGRRVESQLQSTLKALNREEVERRAKDTQLKQAMRAEYGIGWKADMIPSNMEAATKLECAPAPAGMCCLVLDEEARTVHLAATMEPAASVNLDYLSTALQVRKEDGREPFFSLDPTDLSPNSDMQKKRFEPSWLSGTRLGQVLFQADYYLKELSMGEYEQPVVGMKSSFDFEDSERDREWDAREWFVVRQADVMMSEDGALVPFVRMGVEAREQLAGADGLEDAAVTRPNHPLVKYADLFTQNFDLIAERKSVVFNLREVAKASILAKYLVESDAEVQDCWFKLAGKAEITAPIEIPQLWNERYRAKIQVENGAIVTSSEEGLRPKMHGVYGGVQFGLDKFTVGARAASASVQFARVGARGPMPRVSAALSMATSVTGGLRTPAMRAAVSMRAGGVPRGVQFGLDKFTVGARAASASVQFARVGARGPMPRVSAALSMATSVTGGLRTPAMRAAVSMRAGGVPRGVQFGLDKFTVGARAASASVQFARVGARGPMPRVSAALSMATSVTGGLRTPAMRAAVSMRAGGVPRGVQFGLDKFTVGARAASASVQFARVGARGPMPRVSAALSMATSVTGGLRTPAMRAAVSMRAGGVPRGVDLNLDDFDLAEVTRVENCWVCDADSAEARIPIGAFFWESIADEESGIFRAEDAKLLREVYHPSLSDRQQEGELFIPPETSFEHVDRLRSLVKDEEMVKQQRKQHFLSTKFQQQNPGALFPFSWQTAFQMQQSSVKKNAMEERSEFLAQKAALMDALQAAEPVFDKSTEEGARFRIYRVGTLELRTTQEPAGEESVGAVFALRA